ncbi:arylamine N-acetyltransferase family protein [Yinghuangia aomiensis]
MASRPPRPRRLPRTRRPRTAGADPGGPGRAARSPRPHVHLRQHRRAPRAAPGHRPRRRPRQVRGPRPRGGYCFEHSTVFAAVLERLGYTVRRHLGRVGDPADGSRQGRTHMVVEVGLDGQRLLCDTGFGMSLLRPIALADGAENDHLGWRYRMERHDEPAEDTEGACTNTTWRMRRWRDNGWLMMHSTDELPVTPTDVAIGHHYTSTHPDSHFTRTLVVARHLPDRHVTVTHDTVTVRRAGEPTEHRPLAAGELADWLEVLDVPLTIDEEQNLLRRAADLAAAGS